MDSAPKSDETGQGLSRPRYNFLIYLPAIVALALGVTLTVMGHAGLREMERLRVAEQFDRLAKDRVREFQQTIQQHVHYLEATAAFFDASEFVTADEFHAFVTPLLRRQGGIQAMEWIPRVSIEERAQFEVDGGPGYRIREKPEAGGPLVVAGQRPEYYPVRYAEPRRENLGVLGFDLGSSPARLEALQSAAASGRATATGPLDVLQAKDLGVLVFQPRFAKPRRGDLPARGRLLGFVLGVFLISDVLNHSLSALEALDPPGIRVLLSYGNRVIARHGPESKPGARGSGLAKHLGYTESIDIVGQPWTVECSPTPGFVRSRKTRLPLWGMAAGSLLTFLLVGYLIAIARRAEMKTALRDSERRYRTLVEHAPEAVLVLDVDSGRFLDANSKACQIFKLSRDELLGKLVTEVSAPVQPDGRTAEEGARDVIDATVRGEQPVFMWVHLDSEGNEVPCEIRLVTLPASGRVLIRGSVTDITDRMRNEQRQVFMMRELDHRVKNTLATVLSLAEQTVAVSDSVDEFRESFVGRIRAIANVHRSLAAGKWKGVDLRDVVRLTISPYLREDRERIQTDGESIMLSPSTSSGLCLALHELATNASKYGALSATEGSVKLTWGRNSDNDLVMGWVESGGPTVQKVVTEGFGSRLLRGVIEYELGGTVNIEYHEDGLRCRLRIPIIDEEDRLAESTGETPFKPGQQGSRQPGSGQQFSEQHRKSAP